MEDDDEFGDLYTDVLLPISSSSAPQPHRPPAPSLSNVDLILKLTKENDNNDGDISDGSRKILVRAPGTGNSAGGARVLGSEEAGLRSDGEDKEMRFDIEEGNNGIVEDAMALIPGLGGGGGGGGGGGEQDWGEEEDSESEDDLQIVLNDASTRGPGMGMEGEDDDDDDDGEPLVIVADGDPNQGVMEEQDWGMGEEGSGAGGGTGGEGERKEGGEGAAGKAGGAGALAGPKIGYSSHGYHHPFHSQFKYVRPGAAPLPGSTTVGPGGAPCQVRPPASMNLMAGRGRGDWRPVGSKNGPPMQKGYHSAFGMAAWGNNSAGRGFGGRLDFTLPSHKTIFDVDIDSFEEKPWKYPGVDMSDFFNFGLNEESWKDFCKLLEQHRIETTMQSKIRVYEIGRGDQDYDPDMPPELAAATGIHDVPADNLSLGKSDDGQSDAAKGSARMRPPLPTGRAIPVEGGYGERLPSIDTRPPRIRDSDAVIEIVCQDSLEDDSCNGNGPGDGVNNDQQDEVRGSQVADDDVAHMKAEDTDDLPQHYAGGKTGKNTLNIGSGPDNIGMEDRTLPLHPDAPTQYRPGSRGQSSMRPGGDISIPHGERRACVQPQERSSHLSPSRSIRDKRVYDDIREDTVGNVDGKNSLLLSSPRTLRDARELSVDDKDDTADDELDIAEGISGMEKDEMNDQEITNGSQRDGNRHRSSKKQKLTSDSEQHVRTPSPYPRKAGEHLCTGDALFYSEQHVLKEFDDGEEAKAARSSDYSKARSGSSRDHHKWQDGVEEEVVQDGRSTRAGSMKRHLEEHELNYRRKDCDGRYESERSRMVLKGREDPHSHRDLDPPMAYHLLMKNEGYEQHKDLESPDASWQRRNEDTISRKTRNEEMRIKERGDDMGSRYKSKVRESERSDQDEHFHSRKYLENGSYGGPNDKDGISRYREREDNSKGRYDIVDDYGKRRKDEEYLRRDQIEKEEMLHGHRDTPIPRRRERDDAMEPRKRDDQQRIRDNLDDYHSVRHKEEVWFQRERSERQRESDELYRIKPSHEENSLKREREEGRGSAKCVRGPDAKASVAHVRVKDNYRNSDREYQLKDAARSSEKKRRARIDDESSSHHRARDDHTRGSQSGHEGKKSRQDRSSTHTDRASDASDNQRLHEKKHKQTLKRNKVSEGGDHSASDSSRRNKDDHRGHTDEKVLKGANEQGNNEKEIVAQHSSKRRKGEASSDDEQQDSKRGRSKLERWTSHKERDYTINSKSSASLKLKEGDKNNGGSSSAASKLPSEPPKKTEDVEKLPSGEEKVVSENKDTEAKPLDDRHLDTVEKLKKRSERFKLPMPSEKDALAIKKMEGEPLPSARTENPPDTEIKPERPARKRRWISN